jgi:hypothetical protein
MQEISYHRLVRRLGECEMLAETANDRAVREKAAQLAQGSRDFYLRPKPSTSIARRISNDHLMAKTHASPPSGKPVARQALNVGDRVVLNPQGRDRFTVQIDSRGIVLRCR